MTLNNVAFSINQRRREEKAKKEQEFRNNGINYCPHCGHKTDEEHLRTPLNNGADWECSNCEHYIEAYILD